MLPDGTEAAGLEELAQAWKVNCGNTLPLGSVEDGCMVMGRHGDGQARVMDRHG